MSSKSAALVTACGRALDRERGPVTPAEHFIHNVLFEYQTTGTLQPDSMAAEVEAFRANLADMVHGSKVLLSSRPDLLIPAERRSHARSERE